MTLRSGCKFDLLAQSQETLRSGVKSGDVAQWVLIK